MIFFFSLTVGNWFLLSEPAPILHHIFLHRCLVLPSIIMPSKQEISMLLFQSGHSQKLEMVQEADYVVKEMLLFPVRVLFNKGELNAPEWQFSHLWAAVFFSQAVILWHPWPLWTVIISSKPCSKYSEFWSWAVTPRCTPWFEQVFNVSW